MKNVVIGASWFLTLNYCEYKFYLQKVLNIKLPQTETMLKGSFIHKQKEEKFLEKAEIGTWKEFLESEELTISREVSLQKQIGDVLLMGIIDEIAIDKFSISIIDDKPKSYIYDSLKKQVFAYCFLFKQNFPSHKKIYGILRNRDSSEIMWKEEYSKNSEELFLTDFHRMRNVLFENEIAVPTENPRKCMACQYKSLCKHSLAK